jgi:cell division protein ZapB
MVNELNALESKIAQAVALCRDLRAENIELRQQLAAAEGEKRRVVERMNTACVRLEQLTLQLPEAET